MTLFFSRNTFHQLTKRKGYIVSLLDSKRNDAFVMATPIKPSSRLGTYIVKSFKDESFRAYVPPPLPPEPPLFLQPLLPLLARSIHSFRPPKAIETREAGTLRINPKRWRTRLVLYPFPKMCGSRKVQ